MEHPGRQMPMTWGFRPVILLPQGSEHWPEARLRLVLLHELAHIKRHDFHARLLTRLTCALYWFNPLVWCLARRIAAEQEKASDDLVLKCGASPADYVEQVLEMVSQLRTNRVAAYHAVGLGQASSLAQRLRAVLDENRSRAPLTTKALVLTSIALASILFPVAMLRAQPPDPKSGSPEAATPSAPETPRPCVRLVVGQDRMTFEGKETGWATLAEALRTVPIRGDTVLEVAVDSDDFTLRKVSEVQTKAGALSKQLGFKNLSYVGIRPLGSKGGGAVAPRDGERVLGTNAIGAILPKMVVARISPLNFTIKLERVVNPGHYYIGVTREAAEKVQDQKKKQRFVTLDLRNEFFTLKEIQGPPEDPTLVLELENRELATVSKEKPYSELEGYEADLRNSVDGASFLRLRVHSTFRFEGEVYEVIVISRNEEVVRAGSKEKKYRVPMAAAP